jgi:hypothetical protein
MRDHINSRAQLGRRRQHERFAAREHADEFARATFQSIPLKRGSRRERRLSSLSATSLSVWVTFHIFVIKYFFLHPSAGVVIK